MGKVMGDAPTGVSTLSCNGETLILYNFVIHKKQRKERDYLVQSVMGKRGPRGAPYE